MELKTILCTVDFSEVEHPAVEYAKMLAKLGGGSILVVHVITARSSYEKLGLVTSEVDKHMAVNWAAAHSLMDEFIAKYFPEGNATGLVVEGPPAESIVLVALRHGADVITMGTHGHGGFNKLFFGSVANAVMRKASCPVLTIRPKHI